MTNLYGIEMKLQEFHNMCIRNSLSWTIEFSEAEHSYEISARGIGEREFFHVKKTKFLDDGFNRIEEQMHSVGLNFDYSKAEP